MHFVLSMLSAQAIAALFDESLNCLASIEWTQSEGAELGDKLAQNLETLFAKARLEPAQLSKIYGLEGPGSFTGLRVSAAFLKAYSTALGKPLIGIPTYRLFGENFALSLRAAKAKDLSLEECIERSYKFMQVRGDREVKIVERPETAKVLGLRDRPLWPDLAELRRALEHAQDLQGFEILYGYEPTFTEN